jgi:multiple sugar transport system permease protein
MFLRNSFVAALLSVAITIVIAVPGTYAMVRLRAGAWFLPDLTLASYVAPPIVAVIPLFFLLQALRLTDTIWGLSFIYGLMNTPVAFWLMRGFVRHIPEEIDEAAWIDGAGYWRTMLVIVVPLLAPGMVATALICMILSYNEFLFASAMTFSPASRTLTVGISLFQGERLVNFGQMAAASLAGSIPVYLIAVLFQRWLIGGLVSGGVK